MHIEKGWFYFNGYQGYLPAGVIMTYQPGKKLQNKERRAEDRSFNREASALRGHVEHAIGGLKHSNIISDIYCNLREDFDGKVMADNCSLTQL